MLLRNLCALGLIAGLAGTTHALEEQFFGEDLNPVGFSVPNSDAAQADFLSNLINVTIQDFEAVPVGTNFPFSVMFGTTTASLQGTNTISNTGVRDTPIAGRFPTSGSRYLNVGTDDAPHFSLEFSAPQAAFGFYATDIGDVDGQLTLTFDGTTVINVPHTQNAPDGAGLFFGYINTADTFTTVEFENTDGDADAFGFDDFTIGSIEQIVPEPATLGALSMISLLMLARSRRM